MWQLTTYVLFFIAGVQLATLVRRNNRIKALENLSDLQMQCLQSVAEMSNSKSDQIKVLRKDMLRLDHTIASLREERDEILGAVNSAFAGTRWSLTEQE